MSTDRGSDEWARQNGITQTQQNRWAKKKKTTTTTVWVSDHERGAISLPSRSKVNGATVSAIIISIHSGPIAYGCPTTSSFLTARALHASDGAPDGPASVPVWWNRSNQIVQASEALRRETVPVQLQPRGGSEAMKNPIKEITQHKSVIDKFMPKGQQLRTAVQLRHAQKLTNGRPRQHFGGFFCFFSVCFPKRFRKKVQTLQSKWSV